MQRLSVSVLLVIALLAGIAVGMTLRGPSASVTPVSAAGGRDTALAFYDALNLTLSGGSADDLAALLSPSFRDRDALNGTARSASEFLQAVRTLGRTPGAAQLDVTTIEASGSSLIVSVQPSTPDPRIVAGVSIEQSVEPPAFDVLRVARGQVIDRWTAGINRLEATEFEDFALPVSALTDISTSLVRIAIPAGAVHQWRTVGPGFVLIESGSARIHADHFNGDEETLELEPGSATPVRAGQRVELRTLDREPVTALIYAVQRRGATEALLPVSAPATSVIGAKQTLLWSGPSPQSAEGTVHRLGTVLLPAGDEIRLAAPASATLLLSVDAGALDISAPESTIEILGDDFWPAGHESYARIDASRAASITADGEVILRNIADRPVRVLLITIEPESNSA